MFRIKRCGIFADTSFFIQCGVVRIMGMEIQNHKYRERS